MISTFGVQKTRRKDLNVIIKMSQGYIPFLPSLVWPDYGCDYKSSNEKNFWQNWDKFTPWFIGFQPEICESENLAKRLRHWRFKGTITFSVWHKEASYPYATMKWFPLGKVCYQRLRLLSIVLSALIITGDGSHSESPTAIPTLETGGRLKPAKKQNPWPKKPYADSTESL